MSAQYRPDSFAYRLRKFFINVPIEETHGRVIDVKPWPVCVDQAGQMHFTTNEHAMTPADAEPGLEADVVVFATGYKREVPFLSPHSYVQPTEMSVRGIYNPDDVTVGFIGFVRPSFGKLFMLSHE